MVEGILERPTINTEPMQDLPVLFADSLGLMSSGDGSSDSYPLSFGTESWVIGLTGLRGSGKSLIMSSIIAFLLAHDIPVWSNMRVAFKCVYPDGSVKCVSTKALDVNSLYALDGDLQGGAVAIDEIQYYIDSRTSGAVRNRLINAAIRQVRKRTLSFLYTTRTLDWIDKRLREWETDLEIACWDCFKSDREQFIKGDVIRLNIYDHSGAWTGRPWFPGMRPTAEKLVQNARHYWPIYKTEEIIDYFEASAPISIDQVGTRISNKPSKIPANIDAVKDVVIGYKLKGQEEVFIGEIQSQLVKDYGIDMSNDSLGRILKTVKGATKKRTSKGAIYNITNAEVEV